MRYGPDHPLHLFSPQNPSPHGKIMRDISVRNQFIGFHAYENAPDQVAFLKNKHRHLFKVKSSIEVFNEDRELEFFMVQEQIERKIIPALYLEDLGSCEHIAENILWGLVNIYGDHRFYLVTVSEDGENSGQCIWTPSSN